jgi:hypothetical protein
MPVDTSGPASHDRLAGTGEPSGAGEPGGAAGVPGRPGPIPGSDVVMPAPKIAERSLPGLPGPPALFGGLLGLVVGVVVSILGKVVGGVAGGLLVAIGILLAAGALIWLRGLTAVVSGQARVVQLFGHYLGTARTPGLRWFNPFTLRRPVSTRIRNHETTTLKVNDADGNPIEMAAVVVWRVDDTARATYEVDNYVEFVGTQTETAVRHIATRYPYDSSGADATATATASTGPAMLSLKDAPLSLKDAPLSLKDAPLSLKDNADEITGRLSAEISARVEPAGVHVIESRITRLAYAPEIAQAMLRRQQAGAVVAARQRIVEGAVGMVRMALDGLAEQEVVELDEERKAAMVSNLLVVLCGDRDVQPVVNSGTLYQ